VQSRIDPTKAQKLLLKQELEKGLASGKSKRTPRQSAQTIARPVKRLEISNAADADLTTIIDYGTRTYGVAASDEYYDGLCAAFDFLCEWPMAGQEEMEADLGLRKWRYGQHRIFYEVGDDVLLIVRVFHVAAVAVQWLRD
jgi:toxin ParE1/3/4